MAYSEKEDTPADRRMTIETIDKYLPEEKRANVREIEKMMELFGNCAMFIGCFYFSFTID